MRKHYMCVLTPAHSLMHTKAHAHAHTASFCEEANSFWFEISYRNYWKKKGGLNSSKLSQLWSNTNGQLSDIFYCWTLKFFALKVHCIRIFACLDQGWCFSWEVTFHELQSVVWIEQGFKYFCPHFCFCQPFILYFFEHDMHILPVCMGFPFSPLLQNTLLPIKRSDGIHR